VVGQRFVKPFRVRRGGAERKTAKSNRAVLMRLISIMRLVSYLEMRIDVDVDLLHKLHYKWTQTNRKLINSEVEDPGRPVV
jgi:hypothetical protein